MQFNLERIGRLGRTTSLYLPDKHGPEALVRAGDPYVDIRVDGRPRVALTSVIKLVEQFTKQQTARAALGHDCAVFALAHETGNSYTEVPFNRHGGKKVEVGRAWALSSARQATLTDILLTSSTAVNPGEPQNSTDRHFLVRATVDEEEPLYASKLAADGPVALSTFRQTAKLFPAAAIMAVNDLRAVDFQPPNQS
jgi:hypothetical protein